MRLPIRTTLAAFALLGVAATPASHADTLVVPAARETVEGNGANAIPFGKSPASANPVRYQQVYAASEFAGVGDLLTITELRFRIDSANGLAAPVQFDEIEVRLSTTDVTPDAMDTLNYDNNVGADDTLVFTGSFLWDACGEGSADCVGAGPRDFDLPIPLSQPFVYDPAAGNLLLEVYNNDPTTVIGYFLDVEVTLGDSVSRVVQTDSPTGSLQANSAGLVTQFVYTVPEAGSFASGAAALLAAGVLRRRRV